MKGAHGPTRSGDRRDRARAPRPSSVSPRRSRAPRAGVAPRERDRFRRGRRAAPGRPVLRQSRRGPGRTPPPRGLARPASRPAGRACPLLRSGRPLRSCVPPRAPARQGGRSRVRLRRFPIVGRDHAGLRRTCPILRDRLRLPARCANFPLRMAAPVAAPAALKRTPLYNLHRELGAKMVDFGGWEMPVQYAGILEEHRAVREHVGLFDVSHMGEFTVTGPGALSALQTLTPNDVGKLSDGRIHYSAFLTERGTFVDDLLVYRRAVDSYLVVVNGYNTPKDFAAPKEPAGVGTDVEHRSDDYALLVDQGPNAPAL